MATITNKTTKVIGIADQIVLPDESIAVDDAVVKTEAVQQLVKRGMLSVGKTGNNAKQGGKKS